MYCYVFYGSGCAAVAGGRLQAVCLMCSGVVGCSVLVKMALWFHLYRKGDNVPCEALLKGLVSCPGVLTCVSSQIKNPFFLIKLFH